NGANEFWDFKPLEKTVSIAELPLEAGQGGVAEDGPLPFLFGTKPEKAKARYQLRIIEENDKVIHLQVHPKIEADKSDFVKAELWLDPEKFLPTKLRFFEPNDNVVTYDFQGIWTNIDIKETDFATRVPNGWKSARRKLGDGGEPAESARRDGAPARQ
ncbi:MAG: hypothetical protein ACRDD1_08930, partial [Planctomycetia bacterium]